MSLFTANFGSVRGVCIADGHCLVFCKYHWQLLLYWLHGWSYSWSPGNVLGASEICLSDRGWKIAKIFDIKKNLTSSRCRQTSCGVGSLRGCNDTYRNTNPNLKSSSMPFTMRCCRWCLLLLAGWYEGFCGARVSEALAASVVAFSACWWVGRGGVCTVLTYYWCRRLFFFVLGRHV